MLRMLDIFDISEQGGLKGLLVPGCGWYGRRGSADPGYVYRWGTRKWGYMDWPLAAVVAVAGAVMKFQEEGQAH